MYTCITVALHPLVCPGVNFKVAPSARKSLLYSAVLCVVLMYHSTLTSPRLPPSQELIKAPVYKKFIDH